MGVLEQFRLDGRVALVSGANRGIGQALCIALAEAGADIAGLVRSPALETQAAVEALGRRFAPVECDLLQAGPDDLRKVVEQVISQMGRLNILVNNAGIIRRSKALEINEQDWDDVIQVNLKALFFLSQAAARVMIPQGSGKIIHLASVLSFQGGVQVASYTATKSAIAGLTHSMANEWARKGLNVNAIAAGYLATDLTSQLRDDPERYQDILKRIPAGRWGVPQDLAGAAVFLASPASDYVHGAILCVDGGWLVR